MHKSHCREVKIENDLSINFRFTDKGSNDPGSNDKGSNDTGSNDKGSKTRQKVKMKKIFYVSFQG